MPRPVPWPVRQRLAALHDRGLDGAALAHCLRLAPPTVQHLLQPFRRHNGDACPTQYRSADLGSIPSDHLIQQALFLRQAHPTGGPASSASA